MCRLCQAHVTSDATTVENLERKRQSYLFLESLRLHESRGARNASYSLLDVEPQGLEMPEQLRDLLRLMLIVDPNKRPSASSVLTSREFMAFEKLNGI